MNEQKPETQEILERYDRPSATRTFRGAGGTLLRLILIAFSLFQLYSTWRVIPSTHMRPLHLAVIVPLAYLLYPASKKNPGARRLKWYDILCALLALFCFLYPVLAFNRILNQFGYTDFQIVVGLVGILLLAEAARRAVGLPIVIIAGCFVCIGVFGKWMPGFLGNRGFTISKIVQHLFYTQEGVFGTPVGASSTFIFLFILFGSYLEKTGVGEFFIDFANAICGHLRGGPAKVAVVTSALMGTVSGSSVANTVGSGSFTIPMMKRLGYKSEFAGAVEASASTGGQLMPPVMGAAAFLMAESLGIPYGNVIKAALIPALLYFAGIYIVTDLEARKLGLTGLPKEKLPRLGQVLKTRGYLLLPIIVIIVLLVSGFTAGYAALVGIVTAVLGSCCPAAVAVIRDLRAPKEQKQGFSQTTRNSGLLSLRDHGDALENGARSVISVALACGVAGIIVGMITKTGIGLKAGTGLTSIAGGHLIPLLMLTMLASILLGMGIPTTPNYLITSTVMAPVIFKALSELLPGVYGSLSAMGEGYALLPAHLFAFYFGIIADITPPVALAAMAGAAIAKADPLKTGINASRLAIAAFLIPYIFVLNPQMLMLGAAWYEVLWIAVTSLAGMFGVGLFLEGWWTGKLNLISRLLSLAGGLMLIWPGLWTDAAGIAAIAAGLLIARKSQRT